MSRVSSVLLGCVVIGIVASAAGCNISATTQDRYTEDDVVLSDTAPWAGETINVNIAGVGIAVDGGVTVIADLPVGTGVISATARLQAMANSDDKASADQTIATVKATFGISRATAGEIDIVCGHGTSFGSSNGGEAGCEYVEIHVPTGSATQKLNMPSILSGNGLMTLTLNAATIATIGANANGAGGDIVASLPDTLGGNISLVSAQAGDLTITLPTAFSADSVDIEADPGSTNVGPFTDITALGGGATQVRGTAGVGLATLKLTSEQFAGSSGHITLVGD